MTNLFGETAVMTAAGSTGGNARAGGEKHRPIRGLDFGVGPTRPRDGGNRNARLSTQFSAAFATAQGNKAWMTSRDMRLVRALAVETHENWLEAHRFLNMNDLKGVKTTQFVQDA